MNRDGPSVAANAIASVHQVKFSPGEQAHQHRRTVLGEYRTPHLGRPKIGTAPLPHLGLLQPGNRAAFLSSYGWLTHRGTLRNWG